MVEKKIKDKVSSIRIDPIGDAVRNELFSAEKKLASLNEKKRISEEDLLWANNKLTEIHEKIKILKDFLAG